MFAVIDLARAVELRTPVTLLAPPLGRSLLEESAFADTVPVGPWLVDLDQCPEVRAVWQQRKPDSGWGYTFESELNFDQLRRHFRKFALVKIEGREHPVFFRYFDPLVLRAFLNDWGIAEQRSKFMAMISNLAT
ncbi:MAG: DUF4123 domain-containing protein [Pseudomonadota bacterium]